MGVVWDSLMSRLFLSYSVHARLKRGLRSKCPDPSTTFTKDAVTGRRQTQKQPAEVLGADWAIEGEDPAFDPTQFFRALLGSQASLIGGQ